MCAPGLLRQQQAAHVTLSRIRLVTSLLTRWDLLERTSWVYPAGQIFTESMAWLPLRLGIGIFLFSTFLRLVTELENSIDA
jgi:hypothetical protein